MPAPPESEQQEETCQLDQTTTAPSADISATSMPLAACDASVTDLLPGEKVELKKKRGRPKKVKAQAPPENGQPKQATWFEEIAPRIVITKDDDVPDWVKS